MDQTEEGDNSAASTALACPSERELRVKCYCEENVWRLAHRRLSQKQHQDGIYYFVVFISNPQKCSPFFHQLASDNPYQACFWDYHVVLLQYKKQPKETDEKKTTCLIWDMDSYLPYPTPLQTYLQETFTHFTKNKHSTTNNEASEISKRMKAYAPLFRVIPAETYLSHFCSDRMHMYNIETKSWSSPPPLYDCIIARSCGDTVVDNQVSSSFGGSSNNNSGTTRTCGGTTDDKKEKANKDESKDGRSSNLHKYVDMSGPIDEFGGAICSSSVYGQIFSLDGLQRNFLRS